MHALVHLQSEPIEMKVMLVGQLLAEPRAGLLPQVASPLTLDLLNALVPLEVVAAVVVAMVAFVTAGAVAVLALV